MFSKIYLIDLGIIPECSERVSFSTFSGISKVWDTAYLFLDFGLEIKLNPEGVLFFFFKEGEEGYEP